MTAAQMAGRTAATKASGLVDSWAGAMAGKMVASWAALQVEQMVGRRDEKMAAM